MHFLVQIWLQAFKIFSEYTTIVLLQVLQGMGVSSVLEKKKSNWGYEY